MPFAMVSKGGSLSEIFFILCLIGLIEGSVDARIKTANGDVKKPINVTFSPPNTIMVRAGLTVNLTVVYDLTGRPGADSGETLFLSLAVVDSLTAKFSGDATNVSLSHSSASSTKNFELVGLRLGITELSANITTRSGEVIWRLESESRYLVRVARRPSAVNTGLRLGTVGAMSLNFLTFGCKLRVGSLKRYILKPAGIIIGFFCQFGLMPAIAYALGKATNLAANMAFALLAVGCAPGGGPSNLITVVLRGDLHMSIIMTFFSTVSAVGMIPLWMHTVGRSVLKTGYPLEEVNIPWTLLIVAVVWFSLPTAIGMLIGRCCPRVANCLVLVLRPIAMLFLLVQVAAFIALNYQVVYFADTWEIIFVSAVIPYCGFVVSFVFAKVVCRRSLKVAVTVMIETGIQNITFSFFLIVATLPEPDGDIAGVIPLLVIFFTYGPIVFVVFPLVAVWRRLRPPEVDEYSVRDLTESDDVKPASKTCDSSENETESESKSNKSFESLYGSTVTLNSVNYISGYKIPEYEAETTKETDRRHI